MYWWIGTTKRRLGLFVLCCALILIGLQRPATTHAAPLATLIPPYQLHNDGSIWAYEGGGFHSWARIDNNPQTSNIVARGNALYQIHYDGNIWQYNGGVSWTRLDDNINTTEIAADGNGHLYQLHIDGTIWIYTGGGFHHWAQIGHNPKTTSIAAGGITLAQLQNDGTIWIYDGAGSRGPLDNNINTIKISVSSSGALYQLHNDESIWAYTGGGFHHWQKLDDNPNTNRIGSTGGALYQLHADGSLWVYDGGGFHSWTQIDSSHGAIEAVEAGSGFFELRGGGGIWQYSGSGNWFQLDDNPKTVALASSQTQT